MTKETHIIFLAFFLVCCLCSRAQDDSLRENRIDSLLMRPKGLLGQLTQSLLADTSEEKFVQRTDIPFLRFEGKIIRHIEVQQLKFGTWSGDTSTKVNQRLANLSNKLHYRTRSWVTRNNLFFHENERLSAYLMGNNERYLRDLPFLQEAHIIIRPVRGRRDSVDVFVVTKDILSIGGSLSVYSTSSAKLELKEDNFLGWGDRLELQTLYSHNRRLPFGFGMEYYKRNIEGSFIDADVGYLNFDNTFNTGRREEKLAFARLVKPLVNPFMKWTYALTAELHATANMFSVDSLYYSNWKYRYRQYDAWAGYNLSFHRIEENKEFSRLRFLISGRIFDRKFLHKPLLYRDHYAYAYADMYALLGAVSLFRVNYYKTSYVYGFGRKEDLPEGLEASLTYGYTNKEGRVRNYAALNFQHYYLGPREGFFNGSFMLGSYFYHRKPEDVSMLINVDYFTRLYQMSHRWKQRLFLNVSIARQYNYLLDEPLLVESKYGLPGFENNYAGGSLRATMKAESVFFSPWSLLFFRFAPFVFGSATLFKMENELSSRTRLYPALGGGIRTRNESLVFGTIELRGVYFPRKDFFNNHYLIQLNTNLRFKYSQNFIRRPEFVQVN